MNKTTIHVNNADVDFDLDNLTVEMFFNAINEKDPIQQITLFVNIAKACSIKDNINKLPLVAMTDLTQKIIKAALSSNSSGASTTPAKK